MNRHIKELAVLALLAAAPAFGAISTIGAGESAFLNGVSLAEDPTLAGMVVIDYLQPFELADPAGEPLSASLLTRVSERTDTGELTFSYRVVDMAGSTGQITSIVVSGFAGWSTGVEWRSDSLGDLGPQQAYRSVDEDTINYQFNPTLGFPNAFESRFFFARTNAFDYNDLGTAVITLTNGESVTLSTFAPAVPTPGGLACIGLAGLGIARRRR